MLAEKGNQKSTKKSQKSRHFPQHQSAVSESPAWISRPCFLPLLLTENFWEFSLLPQCVTAGKFWSWHFLGKKALSCTSLCSALDWIAVLLNVLLSFSNLNQLGCVPAGKVLPSCTLSSEFPFAQTLLVLHPGHSGWCESRVIHSHQSAPPAPVPHGLFTAFIPWAAARHAVLRATLTGNSWKGVLQTGAGKGSRKILIATFGLAAERSLKR